MSIKVLIYYPERIERDERKWRDVPKLNLEFDDDAYLLNATHEMIDDYRSTEDTFVTAELTEIEDWWIDKQIMRFWFDCRDKFEYWLTEMISESDDPRPAGALERLTEYNVEPTQYRGTFSPFVGKTVIRIEAWQSAVFTEQFIHELKARGLDTRVDYVASDDDIEMLGLHADAITMLIAGEPQKLLEFLDWYEQHWTYAE